MGKAIDMTGRVCGRLTVLRRGENTKSGQYRWVCRCECGNETLVEGRMLREGKTISCGCYHREMVGNMFRKHGDVGSRLYNIWENMRRRTGNAENPSYRWYGGKGVKVCDEWQESFASFREWALKNGYRDDLTIDRINVSGDYCPENCRWATTKQQSRNRTDNRLLTMDGETHCATDWAEILGISRQALFIRTSRYKDWPDEKILLGARKYKKKYAI